MLIDFLQLLLLIIIANGAPILMRVLLNDRYDLAVDFGKDFFDNKRVLGASKTWRGIIAALVATSLVSWLLEYSAQTGFLIAMYAVLGDLSSSFIKRRLAKPPSSMFPLLDQIPESLLPAIMMKATFGLSSMSVFLLVVTFIIVELMLSQTLYKWGIRKRPY